MPEGPLHQPHDKLFKLGFSDPATAAAFLREQIPQAISEAVDWEGLTLLESGSFIDARFRAHESDLLFGASLAGRDARFYLLFEHQTSEDRMIALRFLRYMVAIWEKHLADAPGAPLPVILPVVLAQNDGVWELHPEFSALFDLPEDLSGDLRAFLPQFTFRLVQLAQIPFEAIRGTPAGVVVLRTMKAERSGKLLDDAVWDESLLARIPRALFEAFVLYLSHADVDSEALERNLTSIQTPELRNTAMTFAQKLHQEGRQEGRLAVLREYVVEELGLRFKTLPPGLPEAVRAVSDEGKLKTLHRLAVRCASVDEFAAGL